MKKTFWCLMFIWLLDGGLSASLRLELVTEFNSIVCHLALVDVYENVEFEQPESE